MNKRKVLICFFALMCGLFAVFIVNRLRGEPKPLVPVAVAKANVARGDLVNADVLATKYYERDAIPKGIFSTSAEAVGKTALFPIEKGDVVLKGMLSDKDGGRGLASLVEDGMRAFTIVTTHIAAGVGGMIQPGDRVDVLLTTAGDRDDASGGGVTTTLLQNVQILAVAQKLDPTVDAKPGVAEAKHVTLLVTPNQAAKLDLGMNRGILHLTLRNPKDEREASTSPATMADLRFDQEKPSGWRDVLSEIGKTADRMKNAMAARGGEAVKPPPAARQKPFAEIVTVRGTSTPRVVRVAPTREPDAEPEKMTEELEVTTPVSPE